MFAGGFRAPFPGVEGPPYLGRRSGRPSGTHGTNRGEDISPLTSKQRAHLRSLAHRLKPVIHVGSGGVTDAVVRSVEEAFRTRELLKIRVLEGAPSDADEVADALADALERVEFVQSIGRTAVLYRPFEEDPEIELP